MRPELPVLIKARALIADPAKWGKGIRAIDRPKDTCCAADAIQDSAPIGHPRHAAFLALQRAAGCARELVVDWNDRPERTHAEVLAAFDKAIASAS